ncbi:MAG TPA: Rieske 2Fe-2S domain-containing protein [Candidatus Bathyarchaeia archaeon]
MTLVKIAETSEMPLGQMKALKLAETEVLIANLNGTHYAVRNICTR